MKITGSILAFLFSFFLIQNASSQIKEGTIKIRKTDKSILGKTLSLFDLRTQKCGTITFEDEENCEINFQYGLEEIKNIRIFFSSNKNTKTIPCTYTLISDSSFIIEHDDWKDTCYYIFNSDESNMVKFYYTPQGIFDNNQFAFFYGVDSLIYSQTYLRSLADFAFTDSISKIDTAYKNVRNEEKREALKQQNKERIEEYKKNISYSFFTGKYTLDKNKIILLNKESDTEFATIFTQKKGDYYSLFTHNRFAYSLPLISEYTHRNFGSVEFNYDQCYLKYNKPITDNTKQILKADVYQTDTFNINYPLAKKAFIYKLADTFSVINADYNDYVKLSGVIGGYYPAYKESLNGLKLPISPLYFALNNTFSVKDKTIEKITATWEYQIFNGIFYLYNDKDTLVDEMKKSRESFKFTYLNNNPYVFGAYHKKDSKSKENVFILLFSNNTGVKYTTEEFDYKTAKKSIQEDQLIEIKGIEYTYFKYSATQDFLWIEYQDGNYEECTFFNYNKAIKSGKGKKAKSYYLLN